MVKRLLFFGVILSCVLFVEISSAQAEEILDFHSDITIQENSNFLVKETIVYDFGDLQRHGIYRDIPQEDSSIKVQKVTDENSSPYKYTFSHKGNIISVKIGDANSTISGVHTYNIFYSVIGGLGFFEDHDELYWNVTGNEWTVPIDKSSARIILPQKLKEVDLKYACYSGIYGSRENDCSWSKDNEGNVIFESNGDFSAGQGLTIVLGWQKGIIKEPFYAPFINWFKKYWPIFIPVLFFVFLFRKWWKEGRDYPLKGPVIAQYEPPENLKPAQAAMIMRQSFKNIDVSATIIDLAVKGYIKIVEIEKKGIFGEKDYELIRLKEIGDDSPIFEKIIFKFLFSSSAALPYFLEKNTESIKKLLIRNYNLSPREDFLKFLDSGSNETTRKISEMKNDFYACLPSFEQAISSDVTFSGYFTLEPEKIRGKYLSLGILFILIIWGFFGILLPGSNLLIPSLIASIIILIIFSLVMPKRTKKGAEAHWYILGFKEFIETAEKYRLQFAEKENIFEQYLPYAIIFGCVDKWAKAFEGIYQTPPSWYEGHYAGVFTTSVFINSFNGALSSMNSMTANSSSGSGGSGFGGGGFSGGGGGGGGGGSW